MRAILLLVIVAVLCAAALIRPKIGMLAYLWFALMRPDYLAYAQGQYPMSSGLAVATILGSLIYLHRVRNLFRNPFTLGILVLQAPILASVIFAVDPTIATPEYWLYVRLIIMALWIPLVMETIEDLRWMLLVMAGSLGLLGIKFGLYGVLAGGVRYAQGYGGFLSDNNCLGLALVMAVPLCWYAQHLLKYRWLKLACIATTVLTVAGIVMTHSRGAAISLVVTFMAIAWHSRHKALVLVLLVCSSAPFVYLVADSYSERISTLTDIEDDTSAYARIEYAQAAIRMWMDYPVFGVGYGSTNWSRLSFRYLGRADRHVVHNTYLQMLVDSGFFAFAIYCAVLFGAIIWLGRSLKQVRGNPAMEAVPAAFRCSLIGFAVGSAALSRVDFDLAYILLAGSAAWYIIRKEAPLPAAEALPAPALTPALVSGLQPLAAKGTPMWLGRR